MVRNSSEMLEQMNWWEGVRSTDSSLVADRVSYQAYYSEAGKARYMGKELLRQIFLTTAMVIDLNGVQNMR